jgi:hypothetical protein
MTPKNSGSLKQPGGRSRKEELDRIVARARQAQQEREKSYREQSLKVHPWICARCGREFIRKNLHILTVHHRDHNHDNNPTDGSNWENLCLYCHDNEHRRHLDHLAAGGLEAGDNQQETATYKPFAGLKEMLKDKKN